MAAKRSPKQRREVAAFIDQLFARSDAETWAEFARDASVHWASLSTWHGAKVVPDGYNLLQLIKAAGAVGPELRVVSPAADVQTQETAERLEAAAARLEAGATRIADHLQQLAELRREEPPPASQRPGR